MGRKGENYRFQEYYVTSPYQVPFLLFPCSSVPGPAILPPGEEGREGSLRTGMRQGNLPFRQGNTHSDPPPVVFECRKISTVPGPVVGRGRGGGKCLLTRGRFPSLNEFRCLDDDRGPPRSPYPSQRKTENFTFYCWKGFRFLVQFE